MFCCWNYFTCHSSSENHSIHVQPEKRTRTSPQKTLKDIPVAFCQFVPSKQRDHTLVTTPLVIKSLSLNTYYVLGKIVTDSGSYIYETKEFKSPWALEISDIVFSSSSQQGIASPQNIAKPLNIVAFQLPKQRFCSGVHFKNSKNICKKLNIEHCSQNDMNFRFPL